MYTVYVLQSTKDKKFYIGFTGDLDLRLKQHNDGQTKSLKSRRPLVVVYTEEYNLQIDAIKREREIKSFKGGNAFKKLLNGAVPRQVGAG